MSMWSIKGNNTRHIIYWGVYKLKHRETEYKNGYFRSASKSSVVSSFSGSEDGNESEIDVQPNPPKKHCSSSTSRLPFKSGSGIRGYNKKWDKTFFLIGVWWKFTGAFANYFMQKCGKSLQRTGGAWITKPFTNWKKRLRKWNHIKKKSEVHLLSCQLDMEADRARKEGSILSASFKMLENSKDYKIGRRLKL